MPRLTQQEIQEREKQSDQLLAGLLPKDAKPAQRISVARLRQSGRLAEFEHVGDGVLRYRGVKKVARYHISTADGDYAVLDMRRNGSVVGRTESMVKVDAILASVGEDWASDNVQIVIAAPKKDGTMSLDDLTDEFRKHKQGLPAPWDKDIVVKVNSDYTAKTTSIKDGSARNYQSFSALMRSTGLQKNDLVKMLKKAGSPKAPAKQKPSKEQKPTKQKPAQEAPEQKGQPQWEQGPRGGQRRRTPGGGWEYKKGSLTAQQFEDLDEPPMEEDPEMHPGEAQVQESKEQKERQQKMLDDFTQPEIPGLEEEENDNGS